MKLRVTLTLTLMLLGIFVWQTHTALGQGIVTDGLVSAWTFDAEDGRDAWGSNNCETEGAPRPDPEGVIGGAMEFNGVNDAYNCGDPADGSLDVGTDDYTITCWALPFDTGVSARLMDKKDDADTGLPTCPREIERRLLTEIDIEEDDQGGVFVHKLEGPVDIVGDTGNVPVCVEKFCFNIESDDRIVFNDQGSLSVGHEGLPRSRICTTYPREGTRSRTSHRAFGSPSSR